MKSNQIKLKKAVKTLLESPLSNEDVKRFIVDTIFVAVELSHGQFNCENVHKGIDAGVSTAKRAKIKNAYKVIIDGETVYVAGNGQILSISNGVWSIKRAKLVAKFVCSNCNEAYKIGVLHGLNGKAFQDGAK